MDEVFEKQHFKNLLRLEGSQVATWQKTFFDHLLRSGESSISKNGTMSDGAEAGLVNKQTIGRLRARSSTWNINRDHTVGGHRPPLQCESRRRSRRCVIVHDLPAVRGPFENQGEAAVWFVGRPVQRPSSKHQGRHRHSAVGSGVRKTAGCPFSRDLNISSGNDRRLFAIASSDIVSGDKDCVRRVPVSLHEFLNVPRFQPLVVPPKPAGSPPWRSCSCPADWCSDAGVGTIAAPKKPAT